MGKRRVLFVCTGNTCRSLMAEFISRKKFGDHLEPASAGLRPQDPGDAENAIYTLKRFLNVDASGHTPRQVRDLDVYTFDLVVTMDKWVAGQFKAAFPGFPRERLIQWKIADPFGDDLDEYRRCAQAIFGQMKTLASSTPE